MIKKLYEYEKSLSKKQKKEMGIVYTPIEIVSYINEKTLALWPNSYPPKVIDFSSGTGVFLIDMCDKICKRYDLKPEEVYKNYIYANDIDKDATEIFFDHTQCPNIFNEDGLTINLDDYDIIVGNPPYIKIQNLSEEGKNNIRKLSWCKSGNTDLYIGMSQRIITSNKIFGFICPNSWMRSNTGVMMVQHVIENKLLCELIDFRDKIVFPDIGAYCSILIGDSSKRNSYLLSNDLETSKESKKYTEVNNENFYLFDDDVNFIKDVLKRETSLLDICSFKVGLATLSDKIYFLPNCTDDGDYYKSNNIVIEKEITKKCYKAGKLSRYDKQTEDRIILPYDSDLEPYSEQDMVSKFPKAYEYLKSKKTDLLKRDKGKFKLLVDEGKSVWFQYGRKQGLSLSDEKVLISPIIAKKFFMSIDEGLFISGYCMVPKKGYKTEDIVAAIDCEDFLKWVSLFGSPKQGGYYSISKKTISKYKF